MPSVVQSAKSAGITATQTATFTVGTTSGNAVVAILVHDSSFMNAAASTGPTGFTYIGTQAFIANQVQVDAWYKDAVTAGSTAFSATGQSGTEKCLYIFEVSGGDTPSLDVTTTNTGTSALPTVTSPSMNRGAELVFMAAGSTQTTAITADAGATGSVENHDGNGSSIAQYKVLASGAFGNTQTLTAGLGSSIKWAATLFTLKAAPGTFKTINPVGTGTASLLRLIVHPVTISVVGTKSVALVRTISKKLTIAGTGVAKDTKARTRKILVQSSQSLHLLKRRFRNISVVGSGIATVIRIRCKNLFVTGSAITSLNKVRAVALSVLGAGTVNILRSQFRAIFVTGTGVASFQLTRLRNIFIAGTGTAHLIRTRLRNIFVTGTHALSVSHLRTMALFVAGTSTVNVINSRILQIFIRALNTGSIVRVSRSITKGIHVTGSHNITLRVPRLLNKVIAVTGTGSTLITKLKSIFGSSHKTRFTITAAEDTQYTITSEE